MKIFEVIYSHIEEYSKYPKMGKTVIHAVNEKEAREMFIIGTGHLWSVELLSIREVSKWTQ